MSTKSSLLYYIVQPGDNLTKIASKPFDKVLGSSPEQRLKEIIKLNPQIKNPNSISPGQIVLLGSEKGSLPVQLLESDQHDVARLWNQTDFETKRTIQKNFDVLDWLSELKDGGEFLNELGKQSRPILETVRSYVVTGEIPAEIWNLSIKLKRMIRVRRDTVSLLQRLQISVSREPVLIVQYSKNGLYPASQSLKRIIDFAEKIKLGKKLTYIEIGVEGVKVVGTAIKTGSVTETAKQVGRGATKVGFGIAGGKLGTQVCKVSIGRGIAGTIVCGVSLGVGVFGGAKVGDLLSNTVFGTAAEGELPALP